MGYRMSDVEVYETKDYDIFKRLAGNRYTSENRIEKIIKSIGAVGRLNIPILVNDKLEVIDGQNRLEAFRRMSLPVMFIMQKNLGVDACIEMNKNHSPWTVDDYVDGFCDQNNENYIRLRELHEKYKLSYAKIDAEINRRANCRTPGTGLKSGKLVMTEADKKYLEKRFTLINDFLSCFPERRRNSRAYFDAARFITRQEDVDLNFLMKRIIKTPAETFENFQDEAAILTLASNIYNAKNGGREVIIFQSRHEEEKYRKKYGKKA